jgi:hypothetical protein
LFPFHHFEFCPLRFLFLFFALTCCVKK